MSRLQMHMFGSMLEDKLWGIDDPEVLREVQRRCMWDHPTIAPAAALSIGVNFCCFALLDLLSSAMQVSGWPRTAIFSISGVVGACAFFTFWKRGAMKVLPSVLESMERCTGCGYKLEGESSRACPECDLQNSGPKDLTDFSSSPANENQRSACRQPDQE